MSTTVEDIARDALGSAGSTAGVLLAARWVSNRYRELAALGRPRHLRHIVELTIPGVVTTGLAAVARGSRNVYGSTAALAVWSGLDLTKRHFRGRTAWYQIAGTEDDNLLLSEPYSEENSGTSPFEFGSGGFGGVTPDFVPFGGGDLTGAGYAIVSRFISLPIDLRFVTAVAHPRRRRPIDIIALQELNECEPERMLSYGGPEVCAEIGDIDGRRVFEFYPYSHDDELIVMVGYRTPLELRLRDVVPTGIDPHILREGVMIDVLRWESNRAAREGKVDAAAFFRNDYRAQETRWNDYKREAHRSDRATDDLGFVLQMNRSRYGGRDIVSARDEVYVRGQRP